MYSHCVQLWATYTQSHINYEQGKLLLQDSSSRHLWLAEEINWLWGKRELCRRKKREAGATKSYDTTARHSNMGLFLSGGDDEQQSPSKTVRLSGRSSCLEHDSPHKYAQIAFEKNNCWPLQTKFCQWTWEKPKYSLYRTRKQRIQVWLWLMQNDNKQQRSTLLHAMWAEWATSAKYPANSTLKCKIKLTSVKTCN